MNTTAPCSLGRQGRRGLVRSALVGASLLLIFASLLPLGAAAPRIEFKAAAGPVNCYDFLEVEITVPEPRAANPFTEVTVAGTFGRAGEKPLAVDGFCDSADGGTFRIRFMPSRPGEYTYTIKYRQGANEATHQGAFAAHQANRKGLLRVDAEFPSHFQWEGTKERFFWNGTTAYWLAGWDDATIAQILDRLDQLKVTRVRAALNGRVKDGRAWFEHVYPTDKFSFLLNPWAASKPASLENPGFDVTRFNVAHWQKFERLLRHAWRKDMIISVIFYVDGRRPGVDPFGTAGMGGEDEQRYYRYALARLAPYSNVMWDLANEYRLFRDDAWAGKMGTLVKQWDPYQHLTSTHGHEDFRFRTAPWADFAMYQSWDEHGGYEFMLKNREQQFKTGRIIPQVNEEYGYEDHYPQGWGENRKAPARSADSRRRLAWEIYLAGGYQTTGERADHGTGWGPDSGGGWINGRGDDRMTMLQGYSVIYDLFTSIPFWKLQPDTNLVASVQPAPAVRYSGKEAPPAPAPVRPGKALAARSAEGDLGVIYIPHGGLVTLNAERLRDGLRPIWFNPRDGGLMNARAVRPKVYRAPDANDWVLLFRTPCNCTHREFDEEFER